MRLDRVSLGLPGATPAATIARIARSAEQAGFRALWLNDTPSGDALAGLAVAAEHATTLGLATGVIPLDRRSADSLVPLLDTLPADRVTLGVGSGAGRVGALARVREGVAALRAATSASIVVGALGPAMRELGASVADGVLLSWLRPTDARAAMADLRRDAAGPGVRGVLYARTIVEADARAALDTECTRYASMSQYAAHFERWGAQAADTTIDGSTGALAEQVEAYTDVVDELVLRAITPTATEAELLHVIERVATA